MPKYYYDSIHNLDGGEDEILYYEHSAIQYAQLLVLGFCYLTMREEQYWEMIHCDIQLFYGPYILSNLTINSPLITLLEVKSNHIF